MDAERKSELVRYAAMIIAGVLLYLFGRYILRGYGDRSSCTKSLHAEVIKLVELDPGSGKYAPVFRYEYDGEKYSYTSTIATNPPLYYEFEQVLIRVNPNDPNKIYYEPRGIYKGLGVGSKYTGCVLVLTGVGALIISNAKRKSSEQEDPQF